MLEFDAFVIGTGPAGQRAAIHAAKLGKRVGICERQGQAGGLCTTVGAIPLKTFREAVLYLTGFQEDSAYGPAFVVKENITMQDLMFRCERVIQHEADVTRHQLSRNQVDLIQGEASFLNAEHLVVTGNLGPMWVKADYFVIATGTEPAHGEGIDVDGETIVTADDVLGLKQIPRTMTVVGAGVVGMEYASIFATLGVKVTVVDRRTDVLDFLDREIVDTLMYHMRNSNCIFRLGEEVTSVETTPSGGAKANLKSGKTITSDVLLYAGVRYGTTANLNLEAAGLRPDARGRLRVNKRCQTEQPHIYAVGDVIGFPSLASTSMEPGRSAIRNAFDVDYRTCEFVPFGIYTVPEVSVVGENEQSLTGAGVPYEVGLARFREIARSAIIGDDSGLLKILFHRDTRQVLGIHIIGTGATELVHIGQAVLALGGTLDYFVESVFNYPTLAECYKVAALDGFNKVGPTNDVVFHPTGERVPVAVH
jgi:NAD(P) transhydrogenase